MLSLSSILVLAVIVAAVVGGLVVGLGFSVFSSSLAGRANLLSAIGRAKPFVSCRFGFWQRGRWCCPLAITDSE